MNKKKNLQDPIEVVLTLDPDDESYLLFERDIHDTISDCVLMFCKGLHHGMIVDGGNHYVVTQGDILSYLLNDKTVLNQTIGELFPQKFVKNSIVSIDPQKSVSEAFEMMLKRRVPCLVVNDGLFSNEQVLIPMSRWNDPVGKHVKVEQFN